jgi:hypothetical protein
MTKLQSEPAMLVFIGYRGEDPVLIPILVIFVCGPGAGR